MTVDIKFYRDVVAYAVGVSLALFALDFFMGKQSIFPLWMVSDSDLIFSFGILILVIIIPIEHSKATLEKMWRSFLELEVAMMGPFAIMMIVISVGYNARADMIFAFLAIVLGILITALSVWSLMYIGKGIYSVLNK